ncbi:MAG TPA: hypothetical protein VIY29_29340 [Ktedonobacteraceae bacterium]
MQGFTPMIHRRIYEKQGDALQASLDFQSALQLSPDYRYYSSF